MTRPTSAGSGPRKGRRRERRSGQTPDDHPPVAGDSAMRPAVFRAALVGIVLAAGVARVWAATGELWLDEIWSFRLVRFLTTPLGLLNDLHHDNNHHLNSLYLYFLPESAPAWVWRLPPILAGVGTTLLASVIARRAGLRAALIGPVLVGGSFLLILYGSEARGYSLAVFWAFLGVPLAERYLDSRRWLWATGFALSASLGILSHLTFLHAYLGLFVWSAYRARGTWRAWGQAMGFLHLVPLGALATVYAVDLRHISLGGGPEDAVTHVVTRALSLGVGGPEAGVMATVAAGVALLAALVSMILVWRSGSDLWILFVVTVFIAPILTLMTMDTSLIFERYFLVAIAFLVLSFTWTIRAVATRSRLAAIALVLAFLAGNLTHAARLLERGRGSYRALLTYATTYSVRPLVTIGADHDFRHGAVVEFYQPQVPGGDRIRFQERQLFSGSGPEWFLVRGTDPDFDPKPTLTVAGRWRYALAGVYRSAGISGWHVALYHNISN